MLSLFKVQKSLVALEVCQISFDVSDRFHLTLSQYSK